MDNNFPPDTPAPDLQEFIDAVTQEVLRSLNSPRKVKEESQHTTERGISPLTPAIEEIARQQETVAYYSNRLTHYQEKGGSQYFIEGLANKLAAELGATVDTINENVIIDFSFLRKNPRARIEDEPLGWKCNEPLYYPVRQVVRICANKPDRVPICVHLENGVHELEFHTLALSFGTAEYYISIFFTEIMNTIDRHGVRLPNDAK